MKLTSEDRAAVRRVAQLLRDETKRRAGGAWMSIAVCVDGRALVSAESGSYSRDRTIRADLDQPSPLPSVEDALQMLIDGEVLR